MAEVILRHVYKIYPGDVQAVTDNNFEIADKEFLVLVGPSGCGKSTTLRMIAGLEEITKGEILIDGRVVNDVPPKDRDIAMVFQNYALYPHMSVRENLAFGLKLRKFNRSEIDERVEEASEILQLTPYLERKPKALSGGQRQRVALGRAIVRKPKVFLFDEPLSNLDAKLRNQMRTEIAKLHKRLETTMVYVTHDQVEAMTMGTKIVVMKDGIIQQIDTPLGIYNTPVNKFVAGFIGYPTMNFFNGEVSDGMLRAGSLQMPLVDSIKEIPGGKAIIGLRPEAVIPGSGGVSMGTIEATVELAEPMGAETILHLRNGEELLVIRTAPDGKYTIGESRKFHFDPEQAQLFNPETGELI